MVRIARLRPRAASSGTGGDEGGTPPAAAPAQETYGIVRDGRVATRDEIVYGTGVPLPAGAREFLFDGWFEEVRGRLGSLPHGADLSSFDLLAPIARPPKILCLAFNYADHAKDQDRTPSSDPVVVIKPRTALCGHGAEIVAPGFVGQLDYEIELAMVMGRDCKDVSPAEAREAVFGYMILNDVSARDIQAMDGQFTRAKGFDTFAPCGPWITTADEAGDPEGLRLTTRVNGEVRQDALAGGMHIKPFDIVSKLSRTMTLERGDVISTGTPSGVVMNNPGLEYLKDGDVVEMSISGLGSIRNTVRIVGGAQRP